MIQVISRFNEDPTVTALRETSASLRFLAIPTVLPSSETIMKNDFATQAEDFMRNAGDVRVPEQMQHFAEDSVAKSREAFTKMSVVAQDSQKALAEVSTIATQSAKTLGDKMMANVTANTNAAFDAAEQIARSKSIPEALKLQQSFFQAQMAKNAEQTREFFELSTKLYQQTFASLNTVASKAMVNGKSGL